MLSDYQSTLPPPVLLLLTLPLAAQTPAAAAPQTPEARPRPARSTPPPAGFAQSIVLWPEGAPGAKGTAESDIPKLFTYPTAGSGPHSAVIVMPGGGFTSLKMEQEGADEARWLAAHGVAAFVLEYRLFPAYGYPAPMQDASRAIRYVRAHAAELGVDPARLGVWGFSAGGILVGYLATIHTAGDAATKNPVEPGKRSAGLQHRLLRAAGHERAPDQRDPAQRVLSSVRSRPRQQSMQSTRSSMRAPIQVRRSSTQPVVT